MFCENCGKQIPEGLQLCDECAAKVSQPETDDTQTPQAEPVTAPEVQETAPEEATLLPEAQEAPEESAFQLTSLSEEEKPKKKKKAKKKMSKKARIITLSAVALVLVIAIIITIFNWGAIVNFFKRSFTDPTEYLMKVETAAGDAYAKDIAAAYGRMLEDLKRPEAARHMELKVDADAQLMGLLEQALYAQDVDLDLSWIETLALTLDTNANTTSSAADLALNLNGVDLLSLDCMMDGGSLWLTIPELSEVPLLLNFSTFDMLLAQNLPGTRQNCVDAAAAMPTTAEVEALVKKLYAIPLKYANDVTEEDRTVKVGGLEQKLWVLTTQLSEKEYYDLCIELTTALKKDATVKKLFDGLSIYLPSLLNDEDLYADFQSSLDEDLKELEKLQKKATDDTRITYSVFLDPQDKIVGRTMVGADADSSAELSYLSLTQGNSYALQATLDDVKITSEGTITDGKRSGELNASSEGTELLSVGIKDFIIGEDGSCSGTVALSPGKTLMEEIGNMLGLDESASRLLGGAVTLTVTVNATADSFQADCKLKAVGMTLATASVSSKETTPTAITAPTEGADLTDREQLTDWAKGLNYMSLIGTLKKAGLPDDLYKDLIGLFLGLN